MKKTLVLTLILALAAFSVAMAQPGTGRGQANCDGNGPHFGNRGPGGGHGFKHPGKDGRGFGQNQGMPGVRFLLRFADELELTDDQVDKLETMQTEFALERVDLDAKIEKAQIEFRSLMRDEAPQTEVNAAIDNVTSLRAEKQKMHYSHFLAAKNLLTGEQVDKIKDLKKEFRTPGDGPNRGFRKGGQNRGGQQG